MYYLFNIGDSNSQRDRAKQFSDQVKKQLIKKFDNDIDWEGDQPPSLKFLVKKEKRYEIRFEYKPAVDMFELYDRDAKTQRNETLGEFSPANITTPNDPTPSKVVEKVISYTC